jgi:acyl dehydratase
MTAGEPIDVDALVDQLRARIGTRAAPFSRLVEPGALAKFARATGQTDPLFLDIANGPVAPPTYLSTFCAEGLAGLFVLDLPLAMFLHTDDIAALGEPIRGGDTIFTQGELLDVFRKDGRRGPMLFQTARLTLTNQRAAHVATLEVSAASFA